MIKNIIHQEASRNAFSVITKILKPKSSDFFHTIATPEQEVWKEQKDHLIIEQKINLQEERHFSQVSATPPVINVTCNDLREILLKKSSDTWEQEIKKLAPKWPLAEK